MKDRSGGGCSLGYWREKSGDLNYLGYMSSLTARRLVTMMMYTEIRGCACEYGGPWTLNTCRGMNARHVCIVSHR